jgi:hypothetical protein
VAFVRRRFWREPSLIIVSATAPRKRGIQCNL